ncbi:MULTISPECIES: fimbrial protein [Stenotrophomonas maltophilia group]|uniref:fimbrial protein n=1 Tax=Stenotrophomonas maltophilia group TaxID=995085 RepID=UPI0011B773D9|nr:MULTISPECIES: fimbrial protein [Stenotrophomonas maltophilia group]MCZ7844819.1 fimbrial protein [Stenotrophomonas maltophilia]MDJ1625405.1 fimbrial protein [Stenotrophomonas sepilia]
MPLVARLIALVLLMAAAPALAQNCRFNAGTTTLTNIANLSGSITVGPDVQVGTEIYRATYYAGPTNEIYCTPGRADRIRQYTALPYGPSGYADARYGTVYNTNLPGVGVAVWFNGSPFPISTSVEVVTGTVIWPVQSFDVSLIKTGPITAGTVTGANLPRFEYRMTGANSALQLWNGRVQGSLSIVARTCTAADISVNLGDHRVTEIPAVGSGTQWVNVPVTLSNCPAFYGRYRGNLTTGTVQTANGRVDNTLRFRVDPVTAVADSARSVMMLQNDGVNTTATGIGIQIGTAADESVGFGSMRDSGLALSETDNASYTLMLRARYTRYAAAASSGQANGAATITLEYY